MLIARVVVGSGTCRISVDLPTGRHLRYEAGRQLIRFLFPSTGKYHQARRRGERALALAGR